MSWSLLVGGRLPATPHAVACAAAALLTAASVAVLAGRDASLPDLLPPGRTGDDRVVRLALNVPPIAPFRDYYGAPGRDAWCHANPFVPWTERERQAALLGPAGGSGESAGREAPPPPAHPVAAGRPPYPPIAQPGAIRIVSVSAAPHRPLELGIRFGAAPPVRLGIGERHEGWRLVGVAGGAAHLHHDCAGERELPLGMTGAMALLWADGGGLP